MTTQGYCETCKKIHSLPNEVAKEYSYLLMKKLKEEKRIDFNVPLEQADPKFSTDALYGKHRGQMFGVLVCEDKNKNRVILKAYSSQHDGIWECDGWASSLANVSRYVEIVKKSMSDIKNINLEIENHKRDTKEWNALRIKRKNISRKSMQDLFDCYQTNNFRNETKTLKDTWILEKGMPSGTGDCCAPKLLVEASKKGLKPISLAEFYWGKENFSGSKIEGEFYDSCEEKCSPILGFILCGIDEL